MPWMFEERKAYAIAEEEARKALALADPEQVAAGKGVSFDRGAGRFRFDFLGEGVEVTFPEGSVLSSGYEVSGAVAIISLHYLVYQGEPLRVEGWLAYRDMPGARHFASAFESMAEKVLAARYGSDLDRLEEAAPGIGGKPRETGDRSFEFAALPRLPVLLVMWAASEEGEGAARVLFKPSAPCYLHSEDLAALGVVLAERLISLDGGV